MVYAVGANRFGGNGWNACDACQSFLILGAFGKSPDTPKSVSGPQGRSVRTVAIGNGMVGYRIQPTSRGEREYFNWNIGNNTYEIRIGTANGQYCSEPQIPDQELSQVIGVWL
jgi:hypothetical protein